MDAQRNKHPLEVAGRRSWRVLTIEQILATGLSHTQIATLVARGQLHRHHRGVYVYGHPDLPWQGDFLAAQHLGGPHAYLTDGAGLALHGLRRPYTREIHVRSPTGRRSRPGVIILRTALPIERGSLRRDGPLRYAALPRLLLEFAPRSSVAQLSGLITKAVQQDKLDHGALRALLLAHPRHPGATMLRTAYAGYLVVPRKKSELERAWDTAQDERPWIPTPVANVRIEAGGVRWEIDRYWPEARVGVEIDSRTYHQTLADRAKDERKRAKLLTIGIQTLSISDWRMDYDITDALDDLEKILARHGLLPGAPDRRRQA